MFALPQYQVCRSQRCERRASCALARFRPPGSGHVVYFTPPEEVSGICPHFMAAPSDGEQGVG